MRNQRTGWPMKGIYVCWKQRGKQEGSEGGR